MRYLSMISVTAAPTVSAHPSRMGSPHPTRPLSVSSRRNCQRGGSLNNSNFLTTSAMLLRGPGSGLRGVLRSNAVAIIHLYVCTLLTYHRLANGAGIKGVPGARRLQGQAVGEDGRKAAA